MYLALIFILQICDSLSVRPDVAKFSYFGKSLKVFWAFLNGLFIIWQNVEPTLGNLLCFWANFHCKWQNI